jgi:hypothetical protein
MPHVARFSITLHIMHSANVIMQQASEAAPELQRLYRDSDVLEDSKTLAELKLDADSVLAMAYRQEGGPRAFPLDKHFMGNPAGVKAGACRG